MTTVDASMRVPAAQPSTTGSSTTGLSMGGPSTGRPSTIRLARPIAVAGLAAGGLAYLALRNPAGSGFLPCPFHAITGLWCPGCGMTRAVHQLLNGNVAGALSSNLFLPVLVVVVGWAWLAWAVPRVPSITRVVPTWVWTALIGLAVVYAVLRNLPVRALQTLAP